MKKITFLFLILFLMTSLNLNITKAYVLTTNSYENYLEEINNTKTSVENYHTIYNTKTIEIDAIVSNTDVNEYENNFTTTYNEIVNNKRQIVLSLKSQEQKVKDLQLWILTKYQNNKITKNDYGLIKTKLDLLEQKINSSILDLWSVDVFVWLNQLLVESLNLKINYFLSIKTVINENKTKYEELQNELNLAIGNYKSNRRPEFLQLVLNKIDEIRVQKQSDLVFSNNVRTTKIEIEWIKNNLDWIYNNLLNFKNELATLSNIEIMNSAIENEIINDILLKKNKKSQIDAMYSSLKNNNLNWNRSILSNIIYENHIDHIKELWNSIDSYNLMKIDLKIPTNWYLTSLWNKTLEEERQLLYKTIFNDIKTNDILDEWILLESNPTTDKVNKLFFNKPIKNLLSFEKKFTINTSSNNVVKLTLTYNDKNDISRTKILNSKLNANDFNFKNSSWDYINSSNTDKLLDWLLLEQWMYYFDLKLKARDNKTNLSEISTSLNKDLIISVLNDAKEIVYSTTIQDFKDFNWLEIENKGWLNVSYIEAWDIFNINYSNFSKTIKNQIYINNYSFSFAGYAWEEYSALQNDIKTNYLNKEENQLKINWRVVWQKIKKIQTKINKEDTTKTITYTILNGLHWDKNKKIVRPKYQEYKIEKNVIVAPLLKKYFDNTKKISFKEKANNFRSILINWDKIKKIDRLNDMSWKVIVEEYRYFDSTQNQNDEIGDTTWKVLVFFRVVETIKEWNPLRWVDRIENIYYKIWLDSDYWKVLSTKNTDKLIPLDWLLEDINKPEIITWDPIMGYKIFTIYKLNFDKSQFDNWDIKNAIRYTMIYKDDKFNYKKVTFNWTEIKAKWAWLTFLDTRHE